VYEKAFSWRYGGSDWSFNMSIPQSLYDSYKDVPIANRTRNGPAGYGFLTTTKDALIISLAHQLNESAAQKGYSSYETVSFLLSFIQSLPYTSDSSTEAYDEYPRFPIETLVDGGGDCEDTAILFASIVCILNYTVIYINPPNHVAVGIRGDATVAGTYWTSNGGRYYYCDTTAN
jgi:transglutaminase-like putative cysteine protease